ncbi:MAG: RNA methyltransferase [Flavobacteriales bacterium]|nr:RNA methyltransferase [Flavobacteriales bacterium]|tara:strand:- start:924 stop:1457 length:534 start_codon:yes stop_codon:yes gene_type:complete
MRKLKNRELERISVENFKISKKTPISIILDNVRSAINVGSVFRTSDAFRIEKLFLCGITAFPPNNEIRKSALGAENVVEWEYRRSTEEVVFALRKEGFKILAVEQVEDSTYLDYYNYDGSPIALIFGNEVSGVSQSVIDLCDGCLEIQQIGTKHSMNISVCAGIVMWDFWRKINQKF